MAASVPAPGAEPHRAAVPGAGRLVLDVDTGIDDALALLYAAASPEADLQAVTCLSGNAAAADVERNTRAVLALAGRPEVEVAPGRPVPLLRPLEITPETHGPHGLGYAHLPAPDPPAPPRYGPAVIAAAARRHPGEVTLVTLGPLTNLAIAVLAEPELPRLLRRWVFMGGAFRVPGNTTPAAEWNVHCDPEAARICLAAWQAAIEADPAVPRALGMGLDATEQLRLGPADLDALVARAGPGTPRARFLVEALRFYFEFHEQADGFHGAFVHDPVAVAAALDPGLVRVEPASVDVDASGGPGDGRTIADWQGLLGRAPNVDVAVALDTETTLHRLLSRIP